MRLNKQVWLCGIAAAAMMVAGSGVANANPVGFSTWYGFHWVGNVVPDGPLSTTGSDNFGNATDPGDSPWTFSGPTLLTVTDLEADVDSFSVYDFGGLVGFTPAAGSATGGCGEDPVACIAANYSHKTFVLGFGPHSITMFDVDKLGFTGDGAFKLEVDREAVPEPASLILLGSGLAGLGFRRRRKG